MEITVKNLFLRISPRKMRPVLYGLRGMTAQEAKKTVTFTNRKAAVYILDLVKAGIAAAKENYMDADKVIIKSIACNEGPRLKRIQPWSKGQSRRITKRLAHLTLVLEGVETVSTKETAKKTEDIKDNKEKK
jgi:large subunit ribosomal protein L22